MGRGSSTPSPFGQMGDRPPGMNFDAGQFRDRMDQFRSSHPFPANPGFPFPGGVPGGTPPVPPTPTPTPGNEGTFPGGGHTGGAFPGPGDWRGGGGGNDGVFPGGGNTEGVFPGGGATGGAFPGGGGTNVTPTPRAFPQGSTGRTMGRVGGGWGPISGRPETLDRSFGPIGGKRGSNQ